MTEQRAYSAVYVVTGYNGNRIRVVGECHGNHYPLYTVWDNGHDGVGERFHLAHLMEVYDHGINGTGSVGQVRDMLYAMNTVADMLGAELMIPPETHFKALEEADEQPEALPMNVGANE